MRIVDPGHVYRLQVLDGGEQHTEQTLTFVKREGAKYPGNVGQHPGTNIQEVLRACIDRLHYLDNQAPSGFNTTAIDHIVKALHGLEMRAAYRHGRQAPSVYDAVYAATCIKCGHVECVGECHAQNA